MGSGVYALSFPIFLLLSIKAAPPKDIQISGIEDFIGYIIAYDKNKSDKYQRTYAHIYNYDSNAPTEKKRRFGIFTFSLYFIQAIQKYLEKKIKF